MPCEDIPDELEGPIKEWVALYAPVHAVAHWDDRERKSAGDYDRAFEQAASEAEKLLGRARRELLPKFLEHYPAIVWEDQDECLEVRPEDLPVEST